MPTTTNYGWTTPADTDLVKDGAAAIRTLGSSIDSTLKTQIDAQIPDALLTTKGDIIAASGTSTPARLGVGANDTVLTADSTAATGMKWAAVAGGGMTLLSTTTLSGASTTISSISGSYTHLYIVIYNATWSGSGSYIRINPNNANACNWSGLNGTSGFASAGTSAAMTVGTSSTNPTNATGICFAYINNYSSTAMRKTYFGEMYSGDSLDNTSFAFGGINITSAITSLVITVNSGGTFSGGTALVYGIK